MLVLDTLQHLQLVIHHALISLDILLEDDLDCDFLATDFGFADNTVRPCTQSASEFVGRFLIIAVWLAVQAIDHTGDCERSVSFGPGARWIEHARHIGSKESPCESAPWLAYTGGEKSALTGHGCGGRRLPRGTSWVHLLGGTGNQRRFRNQGAASSEALSTCCFAALSQKVLGSRVWNNRGVSLPWWRGLSQRRSGADTNAWSRTRRQWGEGNQVTTIGDRSFYRLEPLSPYFEQEFGIV